MAAETLFASGFTPDPASAKDVLAFVLCPPEVFAPTGDPEEIAAVAELIEPAKIEAVRRWHALRTGQIQN
ncbi:MAG: hypothetical protein F9K40_16980 [Kofleriaceae bacterium]|nr:MAG: hypothetical protein F9K40_16980 [Kofleriaceae bacterium]MBZ0236604.1 hypothetical protein [Kofleriaceae bacterium]